MGEQVVLFSHIRCSVNTTGRKKKEKGMKKCLELKKAAPDFSGKRGLVFQRLRVLALDESPMGCPM